MYARWEPTLNYWRYTEAIGSSMVVRLESLLPLFAALQSGLLMRLRKQGRMEYQPENDLERAAEKSSAAMHAIDVIAQHQLGRILEKAVEELPMKYRSVFGMRLLHAWVYMRFLSSPAGFFQSVEEHFDSGFQAIHKTCSAVQFMAKGYLETQPANRRF